MRSLVTSLLLLGAGSLVSAAPASPNPAHILMERTGSDGCNADNLLRLLRSTENVGEAVEFCSTYLHLPTTTITVATVTPTVIVSETTIITQVDEVETTITNTITYTETSTDVLTSTSCVTNTHTATITDTAYTTITKQLKKRNSHTPLTDRLSTYPPSRISSACSCLTVPLAIDPVTYTAPAVTTTASYSVTTETTVTETVTEKESTTKTEVTETITTITKIKDVDVTTTITTVIPVTTTLAPVVERFVLRSNGPDVSQHWLKEVSHDGSGSITHAIFVPNKADATVFYLDSNGRLTWDNPTNPWVSYTVGTADPREILWNAPASVSGTFLKWKKHANGNVVPDDAVLDKLQSCYPNESGQNPVSYKTLFIGSFIDNRNSCKSVDLHPEAPL